MKPILSKTAALARRAAFLLALGCAVAAVLGQAGRWNRVLDVANNFAPVWVAGGLAAGLVWLLAGRAGRATPWLAAAAVLISAFQMAPELLTAPDSAQAAPVGKTFKVVQFNVYAGNQHPEATARWILAQDADVVVIEEGFGDSTPILGALKARYPYQTTCARHAPCDTNLFSKRAPIAEGGLNEPGVRARMDGAWAVYPDPGGPIPVIGLHLTWPFPPGWQKFQSCWLEDLVNRMPKRRLIIAGDFNLAPWSFDMRRKDRSYGIERRTRAMASFPNGWIHPFPIWTPIPMLPIDQVYAGGGWSTASIVRGPRTASDHFPIIATLAERRGPVEPWAMRKTSPTCD